jgi:hypothetical protein
MNNSWKVRKGEGMKSMKLIKRGEGRRVEFTPGCIIELGKLKSS